MKKLIHILWAVFVALILSSLTACYQNSKYRVLVWNQTGSPLNLSQLLLKKPTDIKTLTFPDLSKKGTQRILPPEGSFVIRREELSGFDYLWVGAISDQAPGQWVISQELESYKRHVLDISEGLRIDFVLKPGGVVEKKYWR